MWRRRSEVKCNSPWANLKIIDCPLLSSSEWNGFNGHINRDQFKDEEKLATEQITLLNTLIHKLSEVYSNKTIKLSRFTCTFVHENLQGNSFRQTGNLALNYDGNHPSYLLSLTDIIDLFEDVHI